MVVFIQLFFVNQCQNVFLKIVFRYNLTGLTPVGEWGTIRLRTRYLHDLIMPEEEYSPLKGLLL